MFNGGAPTVAEGAQGPGPRFRTPENLTYEAGQISKVNALNHV